MTITSGSRLGRYEIRSQIGEGGMGEVYLAHDTQLDRPVALKILSAGIARDQQRLSRFLQQARAASKLDGRALAYGDTRGGVSNIVAQPLDGGQPRQLTDFKADRIFWFDFSRDGRQLALSRGTQTSDVILIKDFR